MTATSDSGLVYETADVPQATGSLNTTPAVVFRTLTQQTLIGIILGTGLACEWEAALAVHVCGPSVVQAGRLRDEHDARICASSMRLHRALYVALHVHTCTLPAAFPPAKMLQNIK